MGIEFYQTLMGKRFFEGQLPALIEACNRLADAVEKANALSNANGEEVIASKATANRCE